MTNIKKLRRAALEPARVFGRRDFDPDAALPLIHFSVDGVDYWSPSFPTWMVLDGDCRVLETAIQRYGFKEAPGVRLDFIRRLLDPTAGDLRSLSLDSAADYELTSGVVAPGFSMGRDGIIPATPVVYAQRRWGDDLEYRYDGDYLRVVVNGVVGTIIRRLRPGSAKLWTPAEAA